MSESNKNELLPGRLVKVFADNSSHGVGLVVDSLDSIDESKAFRVLLNGRPLVFWQDELVEVSDEI